MWPSSNMSLKKLITNLCIFPARSSSTSSSFSTANKNNKPPAPSPAPPSFSTHLSRHFSTQPVHNHHHQTDDEDPELDSTQQAKKEEKMMITRNFNVLDASTSKSTTPNDDEDEDVFFTSSSNHSDDHLISDHYHHNHNQQQLDFATAFASQRFFFSSPGHSRSLIHHQSSSTPPQLENIQTNNSGPLLLSAGGVPVPKYSPDPYWDFRTSMQEMMEARSDVVAENWEYLHKLLTCYLALNPKNTHECIIRAFSDLLVNFLLDKQADKYQTATGSATLSDGRTRSDPSRGGYCA